MRLTHIKSWYLRYERIISSLSLVGGFVFDAITLKRVDLFWENLWVGVHLAVAALGILLINIFENRKEKIPEKYRGAVHFWLIVTIQFAVGGLLSTFLVFYFRSSTLETSWPFLLLLAIVFACNEILKQHYSRLIFQVSVLFVSIYSFAIFIVPVIVHDMGAKIFILSGVVSLIVLSIFLLLLWEIARERFKKSKWILLTTILGLTGIINILYFTNIIPPIPLSVKDGGVYHTMRKMPDGNYSANQELQDSQRFFQSYEQYHQQSTDPIYVFTSIFAPTQLQTKIYHEWQRYDDEHKTWITFSKIALAIIGGRDGGFRTYSKKSTIVPGLWRVNVLTAQGQVVGRVKFEVATATEALHLTTVSL